MKKIFKDAKTRTRVLLVLLVIILLFCGFGAKKFLSNKSDDGTPRGGSTLTSIPEFAKMHCTDQLDMQQPYFLIHSYNPGYLYLLSGALYSSGAVLYGDISCPSVRNSFRAPDEPRVHINCPTKEEMEKAKAWDTARIERGGVAGGTPSGFPYSDYQKCLDANIELYPTWVFKDGSRLVGVQLPHVLAEKIGFIYEPLWEK